MHDQGPLAQSVEQRTFNPWVVGSIPTGPTITHKSLYEDFKKTHSVEISGKRVFGHVWS